MFRGHGSRASGRTGRFPGVARKDESQVTGPQQRSKISFVERTKDTGSHSLPRPHFSGSSSGDGTLRRER
jgi:hypothetical protein